MGWDGESKKEGDMVGGVDARDRVWVVSWGCGGVLREAGRILLGLCTQLLIRASRRIHQSHHTGL